MKGNIKNSEKYIQNKVGKNTPFTIPENYFNKIEDKISIKLFEEDNSKNTGFNTPLNYFSDLEDILVSKAIEPKKEIKTTSLKQSILKVIPYAAAASIALFITLNTFVFNSNKDLSIDSLNENDIEYWLNNNEVNYNDIAVILEDELSQENEFSLTNIQTESIEDYINSIDNTALLNDLN